ncbi:LOW QUALITY PROTEIN: gamma-glutamyltranspeptidase [Geomicrobium sp. JCM 19039]|nr:LOW QUALITY PROTEIN: gamma-glutamyltranspeptidase [Geomicrobium sp. JCM 19039]
MKFDPMYYPYHSRRSSVYSQKGMVGTSQPLAAEAGMEMIRKGGNAVDAAIATAAALTVVEPTSNGIGGDSFAIVWMDGNMYGMNSSGRAPEAISIERVKDFGHTEMPQKGLIPVTVPGAPSGWVALSERFGKLSLEEVLAPAISYAEGGFPVSPVVSHHWKRAVRSYPADNPVFQPWHDTFTKDGRAPEPGEVWTLQDTPIPLERLQKRMGERFTRGSLLKRLTRFLTAHDGFIRKSDLESFQTDWVDPISVNYKGYDVWELPPNGQGIVPLIAMNILNGFDLPAKETAQTYHTHIEALKLAFADGFEYITDPEHMKIDPSLLLKEEYAEKRRALIGPEAAEPVAGEPARGGTVYMTAADGDGNMVSMIQSNYAGFGSGVVIPNTGISLQNRGWEFKLDPDAANALKGGKRTYHTIIPGFLTKGRVPVGPFGVMGGYMMPQGHLQILTNSIDYGFHPQAALDAARWKWTGGKTVEVEASFPTEIARQLERKGHIIKPTLEGGSFGRGQIIWRDPDTGVLVGGTEPRADSHIAIW